jgi:hypothetical protein
MPVFARTGHTILAGDGIGPSKVTMIALFVLDLIPLFMGLKRG